MRFVVTAVAALFLLLSAAACSDSPTVPRIDEVRFAPELNVDLDAMTRTASGLYFHDLQPGEGEPAAAGDTAAVRYTGWLRTGIRFDTNRGAAQPFRFVLGTGQVIPGFDEGVTGMRPGGVRQLVIPPELGYGAQSAGPIPPNSILVFEIELVEVGRAD